MKLSRQQEYTLLKSAKAGNKKAENDIVSANLDLVLAIIKRRYYYTSTAMRDDMVAAGMEGLMIAVRRFDPDRGLRFSTYAVRCITTAITECIHRGNGTDIRGRDVPILRARADIERRLSMGEDVDDIAQSMPKPKSLKYKYSGRHIMKVLRRTAPHVSLDRASHNTIAAETPSAEDVIGWRQRETAALREIDLLTGRPRAIMELSAKGLTLQQIADELGCTRWWVRTLFERTASRIRDRVEGRRKAA